jgi:hypothetical protein
VAATSTGARGSEARLLRAEIRAVGDLSEHTTEATDCRRILRYVCDEYAKNPAAEVSGLQLQVEFGLNAASVRRCLTQLLREGLVEVDLLLANLWVRPTDLGLGSAQSS